MKLYRVTDGLEAQMLSDGEIPSLRSKTRMYYPSGQNSTFAEVPNKLYNCCFFFSDEKDAERLFYMREGLQGVHNQQIFSFDVPDENITAHDCGIGNYQYSPAVEILIEPEKYSAAKPVQIDVSRHIDKIKTSKILDLSGLKSIYREPLLSAFQKEGFDLQYLLNQQKLHHLTLNLGEARIGEISHEVIKSLT